MIEGITKLIKLVMQHSTVNVISLIFIIVLVALAEAIGVASIGPFVAVLVDEDTHSKNKYIGLLYDFLKPNNHASFVMMTGTLMFSIILIANAITALSVWMIAKFSFDLQFVISTKLLNTILKLPYVKLTTLNSAELTKTMFLSTNQMILGVLLPALNLLGRLVVTVFIILTLFYVDFWLTLIVLISVTLIYLTIYLCTSNFLSNAGREVVDADSARNTIASETIRSVKDIKVAQVQDYFENKFSMAASNYSTNQTMATFISNAPRYLLEVLSFLGLMSLIFYLTMIENQSFVDILPLLSVYVFAAYRLMPAAQLLFNSASKIRFNLPALDKVLNVLAYDEDHQNKAVNQNALSQNLNTRNKDKESQGQTSEGTSKGITFDNVSFGFSLDRKVLREVSFELPFGGFYGIVGGSGSGKTTIVDMALGLLEPTSGTVLVGSERLDESLAKSWRGKISYVSQNIGLIDGTLAQNIAFGYDSDEIDTTKIKLALEMSCLNDFVETLTDGINTRIGEAGVMLSGGQRQRIGIARAYYSDPTVMILDEATNALDYITEANVMNCYLNAESIDTKIIIAHRLSTVKKCDKILLLRDGTLEAVGTYEDLMKGNKYFQNLHDKRQEEKG